METVYFRKDKKSDAEIEARNLRNQGMKVKIIRDAKIKDYKVIVSPPQTVGLGSKKKVATEPTAQELLDEE